MEGGSRTTAMEQGVVAGLVAQTIVHGRPSGGVLDSVVAVEAGSRTTATLDEAVLDRELLAQGNAVAEDEWQAVGEGSAQGG